MDRARSGLCDQREAVTWRQAGFSRFVRVGVDVDIRNERVEERPGGFDQPVRKLGRYSDRLGDTPYSFDPTGIDKVERLDGSDSRTTEHDLTPSERFSPPLDDLEFQAVELAKELHRRQEVGPDEVDPEVFTAGGDAFEGEVEVALAPEGELGERFEKVTDGDGERAVVGVVPAEEDAGGEE